MNWYCRMAPLRNWSKNTHMTLYFIMAATRQEKKSLVLHNPGTTGWPMLVRWCLGWCKAEGLRCRGWLRAYDMGLLIKCRQGLWGL